MRRLEREKLLREGALLGVVAVAIWAILASGGASVEDDESAAPEIVLLKIPLTAGSARQCIDEIRELCERDGGALWGVRLDAPILLVDPKTRLVVADRADEEGCLRPKGDVFVGELPEHVHAAGTVTTWAGRRWVMLPWPLPLERKERLHMMAHESFHYLQPEFGFWAASPSNAHLDTREGRIWLRLELRALKCALQCDGEQRKTAVGDALLFRAWRRQLFPDYVENERVLEMLEGTAEYTGMRLAFGDAAVERALWNFDFARSFPSFVQSFAYITGPAYGLLLDEARPDWRGRYRAGADMGEMLGEALGFSYPTGSGPVPREREALARALEYDYEDLVIRETERERRRRVFEEECRRRYMDGPILTIPLVHMGIQFDPRDVRTLPGRGRVYPMMKMSDEWGTLEVDGGALVAEDWTYVVVPAPTNPAPPLIGDGWRLELSPGWGLSPGERQGDWRAGTAPE